MKRQRSVRRPGGCRMELQEIVDKPMRIWPTKRWWKRIALGFVFLLALVLILNGVASWWVEHRFWNRVAEIRAAGEPASIADLAPKPVPESENAAAVIA